VMGGVLSKTCWDSYKYGIIKFWYIVASCWIFFMNALLLLPKEQLKLHIKWDCLWGWVVFVSYQGWSMVMCNQNKGMCIYYTLPNYYNKLTSCHFKCTAAQ
jgi:hypothetical protein